MKCAKLLNVIGPDAIEIFNLFRWNQEGDNPGDDKKLDKVLSKFEKYCSPKRNLLMRDTSSSQGIKMRKNKLIHMSQSSGFCQNRVNSET